MLERTRPAPAASETSPFRPPVALGGYVLAWLAAQLLATAVLVSVDDVDEVPIPQLFAASLVGWIAYGSMLWVLSERYGTGDRRADYGVGTRWVDLVGVPLGVATQLAAVPLLYWPLRSVWPETFSEDELTEYAEDLVDRASGAGVVLLLVVMVVLVAPLVEELVYRGLVQRSLATTVPPAAAVVLGGAFFALIHFRPVEYPGLFLVGIVLGSCVAATGRLGMAVVAHVAFNATGLLVAAG